MKTLAKILLGFLAFNYVSNQLNPPKLYCGRRSNYDPNDFKIRQ